MESAPFFTPDLLVLSVSALPQLDFCILRVKKTARLLNQRSVVGAGACISHSGIGPGVGGAIAGVAGSDRREPLRGGIDGQKRSQNASRIQNRPVIDPGLPYA